LEQILGSVARTLRRKKPQKLVSIFEKHGLQAGRFHDLQISVRSGICDWG
jgi:hypothetical protein